MAITDIKLTLMAFPQQWTGADIDLDILVAPRGNPLQPLTAGAPAFAAATLKLKALLIPSLAHLPVATHVAASLPLILVSPTNAQALFQKLADSVEFEPAPAPVTSVDLNKTRFKKLLMSSYQQAFSFERPRTPLAVTDRSYACALNDSVDPSRPPRPAPKTATTWGRVLSAALRQPVLAEALGLLYRVQVTLPDPTFFANGGWIYVDLDGQSDYAAQAQAIPDLLKLYAARLPPLAFPRPLFASTLFPIGAAGNYDEIFREVEEYDDGFAKIVHTFQPDRQDIHDLAGAGREQLRPVQDSGIKLGWDDEQLVIWMNRQIAEDPRNSATGKDTPMGVRTYRVDVRKLDEAGPGPWTSLVGAQGTLRLGGIEVGAFAGDLGVDVAPLQLQGNKNGDYWLPAYFTQWTGTPLVLRDPTLNQLANLPPANGSQLSPVGADAVPLRYGWSYEFRVRLADLTGGGPTAADAAINPAPAGIGRCDFRRFVPPKMVEIQGPTTSQNGRRVTYSISRPRLGYPDLVYTDFPDARQALLNDVAQAQAEKREVGLPDPDVTQLRIDVAVAGLAFDPANQVDRGAPVVLLYTAVRPFPNDPQAPLTLDLDFVDTPDIRTLPGPATNGPLSVPSARQAFLTLTPICRPDPATVAAGLPDPVLVPIPDPDELDRRDPSLDYFGCQAARIGMPTTVSWRVESSDETGLLVEIPGRSLQGIFLQPDPVPDAFLAAVQEVAGQQGKSPATLTQRLAQVLSLTVEGLTYSGQPGQRVTFGCSGAVRHMLAPDRSAVTFAAKADLIGHWLIVVQLRLARDWTWDGLDEPGFEISREINGVREIVGTLDIPRAVNAVTVRRDAVIDRTGTTLVFIDAIDPKPAVGAFPEEITAVYTVKPRYRQAPADGDGLWTKEIHLPIPVRPAQTPRLVSVGMALSPYKHDAAYSRTEPRQRMLWLEFAEPVANSKDAYFARVLAHAVDPMLTREPPEEPPAPDEPPLPVDPEFIRVIAPGQSDDSSGLEAMQPLLPSPSPTHFLLPLPPGLTEADPELFGFFVYELRVGHAKEWSTAQGRFGSPIRVTGVQHPAPPLSCKATRLSQGIAASAPFARPVARGRSYRVNPPTTQIWILLYAQVSQADGTRRRNVLLSRAQAQLPRGGFTAAFIGIGADHELTGYLPYGSTGWLQDDIGRRLRALGLPLDTPLSVLAVELLPEAGAVYPDPLGADLGEVRILRTSPLTPVPVICVD
jgi:hypothetical protein